MSQSCRVLFGLNECVVPNGVERVRLPADMFTTSDYISIHEHQFPTYHWSKMTIERPEHPQIDLILDVVRKRLGWEILEGTGSNIACRTLSKAEPDRDYVEVGYIISCIMDAHLAMTLMNDLFLGPSINSVTNCYN